MSNRQGNGQQLVANVAGRILIALEMGRENNLNEEFGRVSNLKTQNLDAFEMEKLEVLESVVQSLQAGRFPSMSPAKAREDELRAAVRLLEHLADGCVREI